jgi:hypothetical protein
LTFFRLVVLVCLLGAGKLQNAFAQVYPVQAFVQLTPPYTGYLPDYADPFNEQLKIILTLNDFSIPSYSVKLKLKITGAGFTMQTKPFLVLPVIDLIPGVPLQLSGADLVPYLSTANLDMTGLSVSDYELHKVLPEGMYTICAEVFDYYSATPVKLSNEACTQAWFALFEPPLLNTPFCGNDVAPLSPQTILFNWSPLHMSSPYALANTEYQFELFEVRPTGNNANIVATTTLPIFTQTTANTFLNYGIMEPLLQTGMQYVWRVKAYDINGRTAFKNNGYSQVCTFTYGSIASTISGNVALTLTASTLGARVGAASWNASAAFTHYTLEVRKTGNPAFAWFPYTHTTGSGKLTGLEPNTQYECRVKGHNGTYESNYSNSANFTTLSLTEYACNSSAVPPLQTGAPLLQNLSLGAIVSTGQFEMRVTNIIVKNGPGVWSGYGKIHIPFALLNLSVFFDHMQVDENLAMRSGKVIALTEGIDQWAAGAMDNTYNFGEPDYYVNNNVDSVVLNGNNIVIYTDDGPITINYPGGNYVVEDENGDQWIVYPDGHVEYHPTVPHIELSDGEKLVYQKAMRQLKQEHTKPVVDQRAGEYQAALATVGNKLLQATGKNYLNADTTKKSGFMVAEEVAEENTPSGFTEVNNFREKRKNYYLSKQLHGMAKNNLSTGELDFLSNKTVVNGQPSYLYIREHLADTSLEELVEKVKQAVVDMVAMSIDARY